MTTGYGQRCPIARALDVIGEKWSLLILRDINRKGPLRFQELEQGLPGVAPNTLSARLKLLEAQGIIATLRLAARRATVFLTDKGKALGPVLKSAQRRGRLHGEPWRPPAGDA
jgi:DNA-binding HxlR family transcriptional regulator